MFRFSIAVLKSPEGEIKVLAASDDAAEIKAARDSCEEPGEVGVLINVAPERLRKNRETPIQPAPAPKPTTKRKIARKASR